MDSCFIFGCGFIGAALAEQLIKDGVRVGALTRNAEMAHRLRSLGVDKVVECSLESKAWHSMVGEDWSMVVSSVSAADRTLDGYRRSYIEGNKSILSWMEVSRPEVFLYTGATSVYPQTEGEWVSELEVPPVDQLSVNGKVLFEAENLVLGAGIAKRSLVLRLAGLYGPGRHLYLNQLLAGETKFPGNPNLFLNLIHRDDVVSAILHCLKGEEMTGVYNVVDNDPNARGHIISWLSEQLSLPSPYFDLQVSSLRSERRKSAHGMPNRRVSNAKLCSTGWNPVYSSYKKGYKALLESGVK